MATTMEATTTAGQLREIPVGDIRPSPYQPRREFDDAKLRELADSMRESGLLHPVAVRRVRQLDVTTTADYELIAGERRLRAAELLGWSAIPAVVKDIDDSAAHTLALIENLQRDDLSPLEEARAYRRILIEQKISQVRLAAMLGVPRSTVQARLALTELSAPWDDMLEAGQLSVSQAVELHKYREADPDKHDLALEGLRGFAHANFGAGDAGIVKVDLVNFRRLIADAYRDEPEAVAPAILDDDAVERIRNARERDEQETRDREELDRQIATEKEATRLAARSGSEPARDPLIEPHTPDEANGDHGDADEEAQRRVAASEPAPVVAASSRAGIFSALKPLLAERAVNISIAPASGAEALRVNIIPMRLKESENHALFTPLTVEGTAEQLDESLADAVLAFVASRTDVAAGVTEATKTMKDAERAAKLVAQAKAEKATTEKAAKSKRRVPTRNPAAKRAAPAKKKAEKKQPAAKRTRTKPSAQAAAEPAAAAPASTDTEQATLELNVATSTTTEQTEGASE